MLKFAKAEKLLKISIFATIAGFSEIIP